MPAHKQRSPLFSIVVPTFNRLALLKQALDSVFAQRFTDSEIIVVDDGSSDGTSEYLRNLVGRVRLLTQPNEGPSAARNRGAREACGKYLSFLDSDDLWFSWTLAVYAIVLSETGYPAFMAGKPRRFTSKEELIDVKEDSPQWNQFGDYLESGDEWRWWGVSSFVIQREAFIGVGGFSVELKNGEDGDLALRLGTAPGFVQLTAPETFAYRQHAGNIAPDLSRNVSAIQREITAEHAGEYPGGRQRCWERRQILARHVRPVALACTKAHKRREAWRLYWSTLIWHIALGRWRFLGAFPLMALLHLAPSRRNTASACSRNAA